MKFKEFNFPTFEEWYNNECDCTIRLGCFYASIRTVAGFWSDGIFTGAVSTYYIPINIHADRYAFVDSFDWKISDGVDKLKEWYNNTTKSLNTQFKEYLTISFIENED